MNFSFAVFCKYLRIIFAIFCRQKKSTSAKMSERKAVIKNADMSDDMQQDAIDCATSALEK
jgi:hypothetical protein